MFFYKRSLDTRQHKNDSKRWSKHAGPVGGIKVYVNYTTASEKNILSMSNKLILFKSCKKCKRCKTVENC